MFWKIVSLVRLKQKKEEIGSVKERFGFLVDKNVKLSLQEYKKECAKEKREIKTAWVHAVSIGESLSVLEFTKKLCKHGWFVIFTTTTTTSANLIRTRLPHNAVHQYNPYPSIRYVKRFLKTWRPKKVFFVESEIFPNIVNYLSKSDIPVYLLNARMSNNSFNRWKKIKWYIRGVLVKYTYIFASSDVEANKFHVLSDDKANIKCFGNLKIDTTIEIRNDVVKKFTKNAYNLDNLKQNKINNSLQDSKKIGVKNDSENSCKKSSKQNQTNSIIDRQNISPVVKCKLLQQMYNGKHIIVFGSIHKEEFFHLVWQYTMIARKLDCIAIFVPRYVEDCYKLAEITHNNGLSTTIWSDLDYNNNYTSDVIIVDEIGVLMYMYYICNTAVVCGSFAENIGGHNPIEPIAFSKLTFIGQHCNKCRDLVDALLNNNAIVQTKFLYEDMLEYLNNTATKNKLIANGTQFIENNTGAVNRIYNFIF